MKNALLTLLLVVATSATLFSVGLATVDEDDKHVEPANFLPWLPRPWGHRSGPKFPPQEPIETPPPHYYSKRSKCVDYITKDNTCNNDIVHSFVRRKPSIGAQCCPVIEALFQDDCFSFIFSQYVDTASQLKNDCSAAAAAAAPSPA